MSSTARRWRAVLATAAVLLGACAPAARGGASNHSLRVSAASSLTGAFTELARMYEQEHDGTSVEVSFGSSAALALQMARGRPTDVLATADAASMRHATAAGAVEAPAVFARNRLVIAVAKGNPLGIEGLADLARRGVRFVMCVPAAPCGALGDAALGRAGVAASPAAREENVKAVLTRVVLGEADAGIVYATDLLDARGDVDGVALAGSDLPVLQAEYRIAVARDLTGARRAAARAFVRLVRSERGARLLRANGFVVS